MSQHRKPVIGRIIASALFAAISLAWFAPAFAQGDSYFETFDTNAPGWKATEAWQAGDGLYIGRGAGETIYTLSQWDNMAYSFSLASFNGELLARFHYDGASQWHALRLTPGDGTIRVDLVKQVAGSDEQTLGSAELPLGFSSIQPQSLIFEIVVEGERITVSANGKALIVVGDKEPLPAGWIAFETFDNSFAAIEEVSVKPIFVATEPPPPNADLAILGAKVEKFEAGSVIVVVVVEVANLSQWPSADFELLLGDSEAGNFNTSSLFGSLAGGEQRAITLALEGPDAWQHTERSFVVEIDPGRALDDPNRQNNRFETDLVFVPDLSGGAVAPPDSDDLAPPRETSPLVFGGIVAVLGGMGAVAAATLVALRQQLKIGQRQKWEKQAKQGQPPEPCSPPGYYVQVEPSLNLKPMRVTEIKLTATDAGRERVRRNQAVKGATANTLKLAIVARWLRDPAQDNPARIGELARDISQALVPFIARESALCDARIVAHLEGIEVGATFTLYRCEKGAWKKVESWDKSKSQSRDDVIALLENRDPQATLPPGGFKSELEPLIRKYVERF